MKFINSWTSLRKQHDKYVFELRISLLTLFKISIDFSSQEYSLFILNFGIRF